MAGPTGLIGTDRRGPVADARPDRCRGTPDGNAHRDSRCGPGPTPATHRPAAPGCPTPPPPPTPCDPPGPRPARQRAGRGGGERLGGPDHAGSARHGLLQQVAQFGYIGKSGRSSSAGRGPAATPGDARHRCGSMPSRASPPSTTRSAPLASGPSWAEAIRSAKRAPKTMPSSSELEANRLAPCTPVQATSPTAHNPGSAVAPHRSVTTPPERWWAAGAMGSQSVSGSRPMEDREAAMVGKRWSKRSSPVASSQRWSSPLLDHARRHGPAHHVAGGQLVHEALARGVAQQMAP